MNSFKIFAPICGRVCTDDENVGDAPRFSFNKHINRFTIHKKKFIIRIVYTYNRSRVTP